MQIVEEYIAKEVICLSWWILCKIVRTRENVLSSRFVRLSKFGIIKPQHCDKQTVLSSAKIIERLHHVGSKGVRHLALIISFHRARELGVGETYSRNCNAMHVPSENTKLTKIGGKSVERDQQLCTEEV